jgi:hypothetical protein
MQNISAQMQEVGEKGASRDLAWNLIAWSSFSAHNTARGGLQFYASGKASVIYDKPVQNLGFASGYSEEECAAKTVPFYNPSTSTLTLEVALCEGGQCANPCPGVLAPQAMGYDSFNSDESAMKLEVMSILIY